MQSATAKRAYDYAGDVGALLLPGLAMGDWDQFVLGDIKHYVVGQV